MQVGRLRAYDVVFRKPNGGVGTWLRYAPNEADANRDAIRAIESRFNGRGALIKVKPHVNVMKTKLDRSNHVGDDGGLAVGDEVTYTGDAAFTPPRARRSIPLYGRRVRVEGFYTSGNGTKMVTFRVNPSLTLSVPRESFFYRRSMRSDANRAGYDEVARSRHRKWTEYILENGYRDEGGMEHRPGTIGKKEAESQAWRTMADEDAYYARRPRAYEGFDEDLPSDTSGRL